MSTFSLIGNLGNDAEVKTYNGQKFVAFDVADTQSWTDAEGNKQESTTWVSCTLNGDGGKLLPFLKKGKKVYVSGRCSVRVYSSKVQRKMCAGVNLAVREIELIGGNVDDMPRQLCDAAGTLYDVQKCYFINPAEAQACGAKEGQDVLFTSPKGGQYQVNYNGFIVKVVQDEQVSNDSASEGAENSAG